VKVTLESTIKGADHARKTTEVDRDVRDLDVPAPNAPLPPVPSAQVGALTPCSSSSGTMDLMRAILDRPLRALRLCGGKGAQVRRAQLPLRFCKSTSIA
jgi:hypothetical protein